MLFLLAPAFSFLAPAFSFLPILLLNMAGPTIPHPQQPLSKSHTPVPSAAVRSAQAAATEATKNQIDAELDIILEYVDKEVMRLSDKFKKKKQYFMTRLLMRLKTQTQKHGGINPYNALVDRTRTTHMFMMGAFFSWLGRNSR